MKKYNLYGIEVKVRPEAKEGEIVIVNNDAITDELSKGYPLPEALKRTVKYHGRLTTKEQ